MSRLRRRTATGAAALAACFAIVASGAVSAQRARFEDARKRLAAGDTEGAFFATLTPWLCHTIRDSVVLRMIMNALPFVVGFLSRPRLIRAFARPMHLVEANISYDDGESDSAPWRLCDLYNSDHLRSRKPVLVFVHGGVWTFGSKALYRFLGNRLAEEGYIVCICDYRRWSTRGGDCISQARDVAAVLKWWQTSTPRRHLGFQALAAGEAPPRVFLAGHSSGAHVCALAFCLDAALAGVCAGFIGLSGVYDVASHRYWEMARGVHAVSMLDPANGGPYEWDARSPLRILQREHRAAARARTTASAACSALIDWRGAGRSVRFPRTLLVHGASDTTVPSVQSETFCEALNANRGGENSLAGGARPATLLHLRAEEGGDHSTFLRALMLGSVGDGESATLLNAMRSFTEAGRARL